MPATITIGELDTSGISEDGTRGPTRGFQRWYTCVACNYSAPESEMGLIQGKPYCFRYHDYEDKIDELMKSRR